MLRTADVSGLDSVGPDFARPHCHLLLVKCPMVTAVLFQRKECPFSSVRDRIACSS